MSSPQSKLAHGNHVIVSTYDVIDRLTVEGTRDNISPASPTETSYMLYYSDGQ